MKYVGILVLAAMLFSCSKENGDGTPAGFFGTWTQTQILGNDYWGAPAYWKTVENGTKIKFTINGKYFHKAATDSVYTYIGTFKTLPNNQIEITQANPVIANYPAYTLTYTFEPDGYMSWGNFGTEALIKEKYKLDK